MSSLDASTTEICPSVGIDMSSFVDHDIDIDSAYIKINSINNDELRSSGHNSPQINLIYNISHGDNKSKSSPLIKKDNTDSLASEVDLFNASYSRHASKNRNLNSPTRNINSSDNDTTDDEASKKQNSSSDIYVCKKIRRSVLLAFLECDPNKRGYITMTEFPQFLRLLNIISLSEDETMTKTSNEFIQNAFLLATKLSDTKDEELNNNIWLPISNNINITSENIISMKDSSMLESDIPSKVTLNGAILLIKTSYGLVKTENKAWNNVIEELRHRKMMHKDIKLSTYHRYEHDKAPNDITFSAQFTSNVSELYQQHKQKRLDNLYRDIDNAIKSNETFQPKIFKLPKPKIGDRVNVLLENNKQGNLPVGKIIHINPENGTYDVDCDNFAIIKNISPSRVQHIIYAERLATPLVERLHNKSSLHSSHFEDDSSQYVKEKRSSEQIEFENCTFQPHRSVDDSIFISERSIRLSNLQGIRDESEEDNVKSPMKTRRSSIISNAKNVKIPKSNNINNNKSNNNMVSRSIKVSQTPTKGNVIQMNHKLSNAKSSRSNSTKNIKQSKENSTSSTISYQNLTNPLGMKDNIAKTNRDIIMDYLKEESSDDEDVRLFKNEVGGYYDPAESMIKYGPPSKAGIPLYFFDKDAPPSFELGTHLTTISIPIPSPPSEKLSVSGPSTNDINVVPFAPILPDWAWSKGGDPNINNTTSEGTKFQRAVQEPKKEAPKAKGWQLVLEEMASKKGGLKKAAEKEVVEKKTVGKLKKAPSKGPRRASMADVISELSYTLAKMKGEVSSDSHDMDDDHALSDSETTSSNTGSAIKPRVEKSIDTTPKVAKQVLQTPEPSNTPKIPEVVQPVSPVKPIIVAVTKHAQLSNKTLPLPPPLPTTWPPSNPFSIILNVAVKVEPKKNDKSVESNTLLEKPLLSISKIDGKQVATSSLPIGYYLSGVNPGMISPGQILPGGITTASLCKILNKAFQSTQSTLKNDTTTQPINVVDTLNDNNTQNALNYNDVKNADVNKTINLSNNDEIKISSENESILPPPPPRRVSSKISQLSSALSSNQLFGTDNSKKLVGALSIFTPFKDAKEEMSFIDSNYSNGKSETKSLHNLSTNTDTRNTRYADLPYSPNDSIEYNKVLSTTINNGSQTVSRSKLTVSDLPLPPNFHASIERMKKANQKRDQQKELELNLSLRHYEVRPPPSRTEHEDFRLHLDARKDSRDHLHYQSKRLKDEMVEDHANGYIPEFNDTTASELFISSLRNNDKTKSYEAKHSNEAKSSDEKTISNESKGKPSEVKSNEKSNKNKKPSPTKPKGPVFCNVAHDNLNKLRENRRIKRAIRQDEEIEKEKLYREFMYKEFQKTARSVGYDSNMRRHPHEKLFAKYNYDIDIIHQAASKDPYLAKYLPQYYKDNSFSYTNIYPGDMMIDYDPTLSSENISFEETKKQYNFF